MKDFIEREDDGSGMYHDIIIYSSKLTESQLKDYELDFIEEVE